MQKCSKRENLVYFVWYLFDNKRIGEFQTKGEPLLLLLWLIKRFNCKKNSEKFHIIFILSLASIMEFHVLWFYSLRIVYYVGIVTVNEMIVKIKEREKKAIKFIVYRLVREKWTCCVGREACCLAKLRINVFHLWQMP